MVLVARHGPSPLAFALQADFVHIPPEYYPRKVACIWRREVVVAVAAPQLVVVAIRIDDTPTYDLPTILWTTSYWSVWTLVARRSH